MENMKDKITAVIIVKDEEDRLRKAVESLRGLVSQVVVVDDFSSDRTAEVAKQLGARVLQRALANNFAAQRNFGADSATYDWVLVIDADEVLPGPTVTQLREIFAGEVTADAVSFRIINVLFETPLYHSGGACRTVRLYRRSRCRFEGDVHEKLNVPGPVLGIDGEIWNYPARSVDHQFAKCLRYTEIEARHFVEQTQKVSARDIRLELTWRSLKRFWKHYVKHQGYKDGTPGLIWCVMNTIGPQIRWLKIWEQATLAKKLVR
jgi:glycosyltransferase involved in cell wall biosynthesis